MKNVAPPHHQLVILRNRHCAGCYPSAADCPQSRASNPWSRPCSQQLFYKPLPLRHPPPNLNPKPLPLCHPPPNPSCAGCCL